MGGLLRLADGGKQSQIPGGHVGRALLPANPDSGLEQVGAGNVNHELQALEGVIRNGIVELLNGKLPEGTRVQVRAKR